MILAILALLKKIVGDIQSDTISLEIDFSDPFYFIDYYNINSDLSIYLEQMRDWRHLASNFEKCKTVGVFSAENLLS